MGDNLFNFKDDFIFLNRKGIISVVTKDKGMYTMHTPYFIIAKEFFKTEEQLMNFINEGEYEVLDISPMSLEILLREYKSGETKEN